MDIPFLDNLHLSPEMKSRLAHIAQSEGPELYTHAIDEYHAIKLDNFRMSWKRYPSGNVYINISYGKFSSNGYEFIFHREDGPSYLNYQNGNLELRNYHLNGRKIPSDAVRELFGCCPLFLNTEETMLYVLTLGGN